MAGPIIEIRGLEKKFSSKNGNVYALKGINLTIENGDIYGIIGRSGAGKSTLVRCINLLERPTAGQILFEGRDLCTLAGAALRKARRSMGMIFQQFNLLMQRDALGNVLFPLEIAGVPKQEAVKKATELLKVVDLEDRVHSYPSQLSGGQKQRIAIARALLCNPKILIFDEATSALDYESESVIQQNLKEICRGRTVLIIAHRLSTLRDADAIMVIDRGRVAEYGSKQMLIERKGLFWHLLQRQGEIK